jgi:hypothetical protein
MFFAQDLKKLPGHLEIIRPHLAIPTIELKCMGKLDDALKNAGEGFLRRDKNAFMQKETGCPASNLFLFLN